MNQKIYVKEQHRNDDSQEPEETEIIQKNVILNH